MKVLHIVDWFALELAFTYNAPDHHAYLDVQTGGVRTLRSDVACDEQALRDVAADPGRFVPIDPVPPRDQRRWMVMFAASIPDTTLRGRLDSALRAPGAFRHFKAVLHSNTEEWRRWRTARAVFLHERILAWLVEKELGLDDPPPWQVNGGAVSPERDEEHDRLRCVAHDHVGQLSSAGLELAVVYLRHVHRRYGTGC